MRTDDPSDVGRMDSKEKKRADVAINDARWVMSDIRGRRFLYNLLAKCHVYRSEYCSSGSEMYWRDGERNVGIRLLAALEEADFDRVNLMRKEAKDDEYAD